LESAAHKQVVRLAVVSMAAGMRAIGKGPACNARIAMRPTHHSFSQVLTGFENGCAQCIWHWVRRGTLA
jgi:hypothetical protein